MLAISKSITNHFRSQTRQQMFALLHGRYLCSDAHAGGHRHQLGVPIRSAVNLCQYTAEKKRILAILAAMNTTERIVEIRPKKNSGPYGI